MNIKLVAISLTILSLTEPLLSQDILQKATSSRIMNHKVVLNVTSNSKIEYLYPTKKEDVTKTLDSINYFQVKDKEFRIYVDFINPLKTRISAESKTVDNELFKEANEYLSNAISLLQSIRSTEATSGSGRVNPAFKSSTSQTLVITDPQLVELYHLLKVNQPLLVEDAAGNYTMLSNTIAAVKFEITKEKVEKELNAMFKKLIDISEIVGIDGALSTNSESIKEVTNLINELEERMDDLSDEIDREIPKDESKITSVLVHFRVDDLENQIKKYVKDVEDILNIKYPAVSKLFKDIIDKKSSGPENTFLLSTIMGIKSSKNHEVKIKLEKVTFDASKKSITVSEPKEYKFIITKYSRFIPIVSTGVFYSTLKFSKYGTGEDANGNTIVTASEDEVNEIVSAAHLNFYWNNNKDIKWFWQLGIGPTKERLMLNLGYGVQFGEALNISMGGIWTWKPELKSLMEGDMVGGTSDIEDNIHYKLDPTPNFYIGISYNLTK